MQIKKKKKHGKWLCACVTKFVCKNQLNRRLESKCDCEYSVINIVEMQAKPKQKQTQNKEQHQQ